MKASANLKSIVLSSLLAAMCCIATMVIQVPTPTGGFVNFGDIVILLSAFVLNPVYAALSAGLGSALADVLAGYAHYAPATFVIKGLMALIAAFIVKSVKTNGKNKKLIESLFLFLAAIFAETLMVAGYFVFEAFVLSYGIGGAALSVIPNIMQAVVGILGGTVLTELIKRTNIKQKML